MRSVVRLLAVVAVAAALPAPPSATAADVPHVLVYSGTFGYRHGGIPRMVERLRHLAGLTGDFTIEHSEDPSVFEPGLYDRVDAILLLQVTGIGTADLSEKQRSDFLRFFACGGAFVGVHATSDSGAEGSWPDFTELVGAEFAGHPHFGSIGSYRDAYADRHPLVPDAHLRAVEEVTFLVEDQEHPATAPWHGRPSFRASDEIYRHRGDPRAVPGLRVLVSLDPESDYWPSPLYPIVPNPRVVLGEASAWTGYTRAEPVAWTKSYGAGRVFYTNLGHNPSTWDRIDFQDHLLGGLRWATQVRPEPACLAG